MPICRGKVAYTQGMAWFNDLILNLILLNVHRKIKRKLLAVYSIFLVVCENVGYCLCLEKKHAVGCNEEH